MGDNHRSLMGWIFKVWLPLAIALLALMGGVFWGFCHHINSSIDERMDSLVAREHDMLNHVQELSRNLTELQSKAVQLGQDLEQLYSDPGSIEVNFRMVQHLLGLAVVELNTGGELERARQLLALAKHYASNRRLVVLRDTIEQDMVMLDNAKPMSTRSLLTSIYDLAAKVEALSLNAFGSNPSHQEPKSENRPGLSTNGEGVKPGAVEAPPLAKEWWVRLYQTIAGSLKSLVVVRYGEQRSLLSNEQMTTVKLLLRCRLLQAEVAILKRDHQSYLESLLEVESLLKKYTDQQSDAVSPVLLKIRVLLGYRLDQQLPLKLMSLPVLSQMSSVTTGTGALSKGAKAEALQALSEEKFLIREAKPKPLGVSSPMVPISPSVEGQGGRKSESGGAVPREREAGAQVGLADVARDSANMKGR